MGGDGSCFADCDIPLPGRTFAGWTGWDTMCTLLFGGAANSEGDWAGLCRYKNDCTFEIINDLLLHNI